MFIIPSCLYFGYWHKFTVCLQQLINTRLQLVFIWVNEKSGAIVSAVIVLPMMALLSSFAQMKIFLFALLSSVKVSELMAWEVCLSDMGDSNCKYLLGSSSLLLEGGWWQINSLPAVTAETQYIELYVTVFNPERKQDWFSMQIIQSVKWNLSKVVTNFVFIR